MTNKAPSGRTRRQPVGTRNRLSLHGMEAGFEYRIVADRSDNISQLEAAGYEFVPADKITVGDSRVNVPKADGEKATVSLGGGETGYVMRQRKEWYEEDQQAKMKAIQETKDSIQRKSKNKDDYGSVKIG